MLDYLVEEVLHQQPESVQKFLLHTSILKNMCGSLCEALLKDDLIIGQEALEYLERANLLVVPLDNTRQWYRYHHLFAEVLQACLYKEHPDMLPNLHRQACTWYIEHGLVSDAILYALAGKDFEQAADLIELEWTDVRRSCFQSSTWLGWVQTLPTEVVKYRPVLCIGNMWELLNIGEMEAAETLMRYAEQWLEPTPDTDSEANRAEMIVVNTTEFPSLRATLATARAYHAQTTGDVASTVKHAKHALILMPEADHYIHGIACALLGLAH